jgi:hypothetical protein
VHAGFKVSGAAAAWRVQRASANWHTIPSVTRRTSVNTFTTACAEATPTYKKLSSRGSRLTKMSPVALPVPWADEGDDADSGGRSQPGVSVGWACIRRAMFCSGR